MLFNSFTYLLFLILVVCAYWSLPDRWRKGCLLFSGCIFYGAWKLEGLLLMIGFVIINWVVGKQMEKREGMARRQILILGIALNLITLSLFKYTNFFLINLSDVLKFHYQTISIILPLGISFVVFEAISFLVDIYKGNASIKDFQSFALYISFFPHLIAGPIVRIHQFVPQAMQEKRFDINQFFSGLDLLCIGAIKKVAVADNLAPLIDGSFSSAHASAWDFWLTGCLFSMQIYLDFAGYTDMARGTARLLGYELPINFDFPYLSRSIGEFWRRWHITLSNWLRDYLYIPLGGSRAGSFRTCVNLIITMALGGLWHGAGWTYLLWGFYQGTALVIHRLSMQSKTVESFFEKNIFGQAVAWALTYVTVVGSWIIFRAHDGQQLISWLTVLLTPQKYLIMPEYLLWIIPVAGFLAILKFLHAMKGESSLDQFSSFRPLYYSMTLLLLTILAPQSQQFIYFQF
jgi:alginate O-acetyltransferase complex protein AlgI